MHLPGTKQVCADYLSRNPSTDWPHRPLLGGEICEEEGVGSDDIDHRKWTAAVPSSEQQEAGNGLASGEKEEVESRHEFEHGSTGGLGDSWPVCEQSGSSAEHRDEDAGPVTGPVAEAENSTGATAGKGEQQEQCIYTALEHGGQQEEKDAPGPNAAAQETSRGLRQVPLRGAFWWSWWGGGR